ncbi:hypothetical protein [Pedobacter terrae]|uniref:hypothetical protein n=1 Tax=Pedobacter terrae TaxID=405671 RepID=UPI002FFC66E0
MIRLKRAILATKIPQNPKSQIDKILCDADLFHLGQADFRSKGKLMHKENERIYKKDISKSDWRKKDIQFLESHHYHTDYANLLLSDQKQKNIEKLKSKLTAQEVINTELEEPKNFAPVIVTDKKKKDKENRPDKGIETMFRITSANNQRLSDMADNKAHILITVNSIMLSLIVSLLLRRLEDHGT